MALPIAVAGSSIGVNAAAGVAASGGAAVAAAIPGVNIAFAAISLGLNLIQRAKRKKAEARAREKLYDSRAIEVAIDSEGAPVPLCFGRSFSQGLPAYFDTAGAFPALPAEASRIGHMPVTADGRRNNFLCMQYVFSAGHARRVRNILVDGKRNGSIVSSLDGLAVAEYLPGGGASPAGRQFTADITDTDRFTGLSVVTCFFRHVPDSPRFKAPHPDVLVYSDGLPTAGRIPNADAGSREWTGRAGAAEITTPLAGYEYAFDADNALPSLWADAALYVRELVLWSSGAVSLRLADTADGASAPAGDDLRGVVREGLRIEVTGPGGTMLALDGIHDSDLAEPYGWRPDNAADVVAYLGAETAGEAVVTLRYTPPDYGNNLVGVALEYLLNDWGGPHSIGAIDSGDIAQDTFDAGAARAALRVQGPLSDITEDDADAILVDRFRETVPGTDPLTMVSFDDAHDTYADWVAVHHVVGSGLLSGLGIDDPQAANLLRYEFNGKVGSDEEWFDALDALLFPAPGAKFYWRFPGDGKLALDMPDSSRSAADQSVLTIDESMLLEDVAEVPPDAAAVVNRVTVNFANVDKLGAADSVTFPPPGSRFEQLLLANDGGQVLPVEIAARGVDNPYHARMVANTLILLSHREDYQISMCLGGLNLTPGDVVRITNARQDLDVYARVDTVQLHGMSYVSVAAKRFVPSDFAWIVSEQDARPLLPDRPEGPLAPASVAAALAERVVTVAATGDADAFTASFEFQFRLDGGEWEPLAAAPPDAPSVAHNVALAHGTFRYRARAADTEGERSAWTESADLQVPPAPTAARAAMSQLYAVNLISTLPDATNEIRASAAGATVLSVTQANAATVDKIEAGISDITANLSAGAIAQINRRRRSYAAIEAGDVVSIRDDDAFADYQVTAVDRTEIQGVLRRADLTVSALGAGVESPTANPLVFGLSRALEPVSGRNAVSTVYDAMIGS